MNFNFQLHGLRGLAALMVMVGHVLGGYNNAHGGHDNWLSIANHIGRFGVEIFFVLSGYVIFHSLQRHDAATFIKHRFWRIYPVFACFTLLYFIANRVLNIEPDSDSVAYLLANLAFLDLFLSTPALTPNAWTITYEVWFYVLAMLLFKARHWWLAALPALAFAVAFPLTAYFAAGMILAVSERRIRSVKVPLVLELAVAGALCFVLSLGKLSYTWGADWRVPAAFILTIALFAVLLTERSALALALRSRPLLWVGTISYSLYLSHPYPYFVLKKVIGSAPAPLFLISVSAASLAFAYLIYKTIEQPLYKRMTGRAIYTRTRALAASH